MGHELELYSPHELAPVAMFSYHICVQISQNLQERGLTAKLANANLTHRKLTTQTSLKYDEALCHATLSRAIFEVSVVLTSVDISAGTYRVYPNDKELSSQLWSKLSS